VLEPHRRRKIDKIKGTNKMPIKGKVFSGEYQSTMRINPVKAIKLTTAPILLNVHLDLEDGISSVVVN
jgi:hypothetical protein